jgi:hypothetical protein
MVGRYYGANEDLGLANFLGAFEDDTLGLARTALADTPASDGAVLRLHGALLSLLRAYLPPMAAKLWREACDEFVFPQGFSQGWTELVRLWELQCVIAELTRAETHWVKRPDPGGRGVALGFVSMDHGGVLRSGCTRSYDKGHYEVVAHGC